MYDVYQTMDRKYNSLGLIVLLGFRQTTKYISFKYYIGIGGHCRFYSEKTSTYKDTYPKGKGTFHTGFELGFRF